MAWTLSLYLCFILCARHTSAAKALAEVVSAASSDSCAFVQKSVLYSMKRSGRTAFTPNSVAEVSESKGTNVRHVVAQRELPARQHTGHRSRTGNSVRSVSELSSDPYIFTMFDDKYSHFVGQWQRCTERALGIDTYQNRVSVVNVTSEKLSYAAPSLLQISPAYLQFFLPKFIRDGLVRGRNLMHLDIDLFLLKDPRPAFVDKYPNADIVAEADCASNPGCQWYITGAYKDRHGDTDPLAERGFMLNTGAMFFRSSSRVIDFFDEYIAAREALGPQWGDQTLFNEVLLQWNCTWTKPDGSAAPAGHDAYSWLQHTSLHAACAGTRGLHTHRQHGPLNLVVLPYRVVSRSVGKVPDPQTVAVHPAGDKQSKDEVLKLAAAACA